MKTEAMQWRDILNILNLALSEMNVQGVSVVRNFQPSKGHFPRPHLLVHRLFTKSIAYVGEKTLIENGAPVKILKEIQEIHYQIDAIKKAEPGNTEALTAFEIARLVKLWLNSTGGGAYIRSLGYGNLRAGDIRQPDFINENDVWETNPNFDLILICENDFKTDGKIIGGFMSDIKRI